MTLKERIQAGLDGKFVGLDNGLGKVNKVIYGVQRGVYTLLGGLSGSFKTTIIDFILLNALQDAEKKGIEFNVFYHSYEIDEISKKMNWLSVRIKQKYGITIPPEVIKGYGNENKLTVEQLALVDAEIPYIEELFKRIHFRFVPQNPTGIYNELWKFQEERGTIQYEEYLDHDNKPKKKVVGYIPNNPEAYTVVFLDHLYHLKKEREYSTKEVIDKYSEYCVALRNLFKISFFNVQQFNRSLSSTERQKFKGVDISPEESDFKETGNTYQDSDICVGLLNAWKLDLTTCIGYDLKIIKDKFLMFKVIKNRLGRDNVAVGLLTEASSGSFRPLPDLGTPELAEIYSNLKD